MNILIVEDDLLIAEMLKEMLEELNHKVVAIKSTFEDVISFLNLNNQPDLVFLDINLEQIKTGIDIATKLNDTYQLPFVYLTSYSDSKTIKNASKTLPEAYLTKPFNNIQLLSTLEVVKQKLYVNSITIKDGIKTVNLLVTKICYIKSDKNYLEIYTTNERYTIRDSMNNFLSQQISEIVRVHRSFAVNISFINNITANEVVLSNTSIPLSRKYRNELTEKFQK